MAAVEDTALVMRTKPYRETSAMVNLFSMRHGRITAVRKGIRRGKGGTPLEPFSHIKISLIGRSGLKTLTQFELIKRYQLANEGLAAGFYIYELLTRGLLEHQVEEQIFIRALTTIEAINSGSITVPLRRFERFFLEMLGYGIDFDQTQTGALLEDSTMYEFQSEVGFVEVPSRGMTGELIKRIGREDYIDTDVIKGARTLYQQALAQVIGEKPLISRSLLNPVRTPTQ
ncbi:MAG: DNA repair protein RecO (recombination protein O) [Candidatus Azotimanducaceae bacterium]|jgi:DNA repair protein RecO (recombination protein O)